MSLTTFQYINMIPTPRLNTAPSENIPDQPIKQEGFLIDMQLDDKIRMIRFLVKTMISIHGGEAWEQHPSVH